jgi:hypothetical protein
LKRCEYTIKNAKMEGDCLAQLAFCYQLKIEGGPKQWWIDRDHSGIPRRRSLLPNPAEFTVIMNWNPRRKS